MKGGSAKTKGEQQARLRNEKLNRLKKTGNAKDAANLFKDFL